MLYFKSSLTRFFINGKSGLLLYCKRKIGAPTYTIGNIHLKVCYLFIVYLIIRYQHTRTSYNTYELPG